VTRLTLRARFVFLAALLVLLVGAAVGAAGYLTLRHSLIARAERQARDQARQLASLVDTPDRQGEQGNLVDINDPSLTHEFARAGMLITIQRTDGRPIQASSEGPAPSLTATVRGRCLRSGTAQDRLSHPAVAIACYRIGGSRSPLGLSVVAAPLHDAAQSLARLRDTLLLGILAGVVLAALLAWGLAHRALRPARSIAETAESIKGGDLTRRIDHRGPHDELGALAGVLDACFAELEEAMERQRRFVADASHELKTPIAAIRAHVELLRGWAALDPKARETSLTSLDQATRAAARLVSDLLYLAKLDRERPAVRAHVRVDQLLVDVVREAQLLRLDVPIRFDRLDEVEMEGDELRLHQLLLNLFDNALRVSPGSRTVAVTLTRTETAAIVTVTDQGPGIPPGDLERIFDRFYSDAASIEQRRGATGLGLAIARKIAEDHGGRLSARNEAGGGAVLTLELPLASMVSSNSHRTLNRVSSTRTTVLTSPRKETGGE
jgi:signal transduction histidine kinase